MRRGAQDLGSERVDHRVRESSQGQAVDRGRPVGHVQLGLHRLGRTTRGEQPHHREPDQTIDEQAHRQTRQSVGPVVIVHDEQQRPSGQEVLEVRREPVDQPQGLVRHLHEVGERLRAQHRARTRPQREQQRRGRGDLTDLLGLAHPDGEPHPRRLGGDRPDEGGLADTRFAGHDDDGAPATARGPPEDEQDLGDLIGSSQQTRPGRHYARATEREASARTTVEPDVAGPFGAIGSPATPPPRFGAEQ